MGFLIWLEQSWLADWVRVSVAGYPAMIASHAIGMSVMVGLAVVLSIRLLGGLRNMPYAALHRFLGVAWLGFGVNFLSGVGLFAAQATGYVTDGVFLAKLVLVLLGAITVGYLQTAVGRDASAWHGPPPAGVRAVAVGSIGCWVGAIVLGRLTAYL